MSQIAYFVKAAKRPSTRFDTATESLVYSLMPEAPVSSKQMADIVLSWVKEHPDDGPSMEASGRSVWRWRICSFGGGFRPRF